ncbi:MAG: hypothetical protein E7270_09510 [Lachnospiraceae bacterium]|nr:hypothetical protein [Lachnospiraceae bacterium]
MKGLKNKYQNEIIILNEMISQAEKRLKKAPDGKLKIVNKKGKLLYYYRSKEDNIYRYLKKAEHKLAQEIAQRDYDNKFVKLANERIKFLEKFCEKEEKTSLKSLYSNTCVHRRNLIDAPVLSDEEYIVRWQEEEYNKKSFGEFSTEIYTDRGERVRSKSEKIIADKLNNLGIPYKYECAKILKGNIKIHPDFTILKMPERKEVYLEHLGMMDDSKYVESAMDRIKNYEENGIYLGKELYITYETSRRPLNTKVLDDFLKNVFIE